VRRTAFFLDGLFRAEAGSAHQKKGGEFPMNKITRGFVVLAFSLAATM
jgi:hypothetical protein